MTQQNQILKKDVITCSVGVIDGNFTAFDGTGGKIVKDSGKKASDFANASHASNHISTGSDAIAIAVAGGASGLLSGSDKTKLDATMAGLGSATDNAVVRFDGSGGKTVQNSSVTINDNGTINIPSNQNIKVNSANPKRTMMLLGSWADIDATSSSGLSIAQYRKAQWEIINGVQYPNAAKSQYATWHFRMPKNYDGGAIIVTPTFVPKATCADSTTIQFDMYIVTLEDKGALLGTWSDTYNSTRNIDSSFTAGMVCKGTPVSVTPGGTPNGGDFFHLWVNVSSSSTSTIDFVVPLIMLEFGISTYSE
jgi:hypothetical protein